MRIGIISGYFALGISHIGHVDLIKGAAWDSDFLIVIVNNDRQTLTKYGFVPISAVDRIGILQELCPVDGYTSFLAIESIDEDESVAKTLEMLFHKYDERRYKNFTFYNSGDRGKANANPKELEVCERLGIEVKYLDMPKRGSSSDLIKKIKEQGVKETRIANGEYLVDLAQFAQANYELNKALWENDPNNKHLKPGSFGYH